jgi:hypothetical protein
VVIGFTVRAILPPLTVEMLNINDFGRTLAMIAQARGTCGRLLLALCFCALAVTARAQQQLPEDPEDDIRLGLWLDQEFSAGLGTNKSLEAEVDERFDKGASNLYEYFVQGGVAFRLQRWFTVLPIYRYRHSKNAYENRIILNLALSRPKGAWRPNIRTRIEGRFPDKRPASARLRFRPGIDYVLPLRTGWRPSLFVNNEFFLVPWDNPYSSGGAYTQNRFQPGVRLPITDSFAVRPFYLLQSENEPKGWITSQIIGFSLAYKISRKTKKGSKALIDPGAE